jgi:hypothetical protein
MTTESSSFNQAFTTFLTEVSRLAESNEGESIRSVKIFKMPGNGSWIAMVKTIQSQWTWIISSQLDRLFLVENGVSLDTGNMTHDKSLLTGLSSVSELPRSMMVELSELFRILAIETSSQSDTTGSSVEKRGRECSTGTETPA